MGPGAATGALTKIQIRTITDVIKFFKCLLLYWVSYHSETLAQKIISSWLFDKSQMGTNRDADFYILDHYHLSNPRHLYLASLSPFAPGISLSGQTDHYIFPAGAYSFHSTDFFCQRSINPGR